MSKVVYRKPGLEVYKDGTILLMRCPKCGLENWALAVASGSCAWCGYDAHKDKELKKKTVKAKE